MRATMRPYSHYQPSGLYWAPRLPEHWSVVRNLGLFRERVQRGRPEAELLAVSIGNGVLPQNELASITDRKLTASDDRSNYRFVEVGDLVYNKMRMWQGAIGVSRYTGIVSPAYVVLEPLDGVDSRFFYYQFKTPGFVSEAGRFSYGIADDVNSLRYQHFRGLYSIVPPLGEQRLIADFLDRETARIDALIAKQERLIELLGEKWQAMLTRAVTEGMADGYPSLEAAQICWLGRVPKGWTPGVKLGHLAAQDRSSFVNGPFGSDLLTEELTTEGVPVVYIRDLQETGYSRVSTVCVTPEKAAELSSFAALPGDVLIAKVGDPPGEACVYPSEEPPAVFTQDVIRLRPDPAKVDGRFLAYLLNSTWGRSLMDSMSIESTRKRVALGDIKLCRVPLPPLGEQVRIADYLDGRLEFISALRERATEAVARLEERRRAVISASVSGEIDVRSWAPSGREMVFGG